MHNPYRESVMSCPGGIRSHAGRSSSLSVRVQRQTDSYGITDSVLAFGTNDSSVRVLERATTRDCPYTADALLISLGALGLWASHLSALPQKPKGVPKLGTPIVTSYCLMF